MPSEATVTHPAWITSGVIEVFDTETSKMFPDPIVTFPVTSVGEAMGSTGMSTELFTWVTPVEEHVVVTPGIGEQGEVVDGVVVLDGGVAIAEQFQWSSVI